jgi:hypothetical protein
MSIARTIALVLCASIAAPSSASEAAPTAAELAKDRAAAAEKAFRAAAAAHRAGRAPVEAVYAWSVRWLDARLGAAPKAARQALADHGKRMADLEAEVQKMAAAGRAGSLDADAAAYYRIEAEQWSARGKRTP